MHIFGMWGLEYLKKTHTGMKDMQTPHKSATARFEPVTKAKPRWSELLRSQVLSWEGQETLSLQLLFCFICVYVWIKQCCHFNSFIKPGIISFLTERDSVMLSVFLFESINFSEVCSVIWMWLFRAAIHTLHQDQVWNVTFHVFYTLQSTLKLWVNLTSE